MSKSVQNLAEFGQNTKPNLAAQHLRDMREYINQAENSLQQCEIEFSAPYLKKLLVDILIFGESVQKAREDVKAGKQDASESDSENYDTSEQITIETEKIIALADVLKTANQSGHNLFEGTAETLLCSIIVHAKAIDAAAKKIG